MFKSKAAEKDQSAAINVAEVMQRSVQQQDLVEQPPPRREPTADAVTRSCIDSGDARGHRKMQQMRQPAVYAPANPKVAQVVALREHD